MKGPVVFDFDKTLTYKDTLLGFYRESASNFMFRLKYPVLFLSAILFKSGLISNDSLKNIGVRLYLKGYRKSDLEKIALRYSSKIKLNNIYHNDFLKYPSDQVIVISASFEEYLKPLFPDCRVVGSTLNYQENKLIGLSVNMYAERKKHWLNEQNVDRVDVFYTDSFTDRPVMNMSNKVYIVEDGKKEKIEEPEKNSMNINTIKRHISNIPGWRTGRKLLVIESDDWGSIRMPNRDVRRRLIEQGVVGEDNRYNRYDTLATADDLQALFGVFQKYKDIYGNHAVFTPVTISGNPDFTKVERDDFQNYYSEPFTDTLKKYYSNDQQIYSLWKEGIHSGIFRPQFHGREHLNVAEWLRALRGGDEVTTIAFKEHCWGFHLSNNDHVKIDSLQAAFDLYEIEDLEVHEEAIREGLEMFEDLFGYRASFFVPPNGPFNNSLEKTAAEYGIKYMSKAKRQIEPLGNGKTRTVYHTPGGRNEHGQLTLTRNCVFEPSEEGKDWVDSCLGDIKIAFRMRKPAVVSTHRVNYIGALEESNRTRGLRQLDQLLASVTKQWPEVEFITSDQLGDIITGKKING